MPPRKKKKSVTGIRYTRDKKLEVVNYIDDYNAKYGRGGQSAAAKKFKITPLTVAKWNKEFTEAEKVAAKNTSGKKPKPTPKAKAFGSGQRGTRYSNEQKAQVVDFVNQYNEKHGRGGQSQAAKKFGLSVLTVASWLRSPYVASSAAASATKLPTGANAKMAALIQVSDELRKAEAETARLRAKYDAIRASIQGIL